MKYEKAWYSAVAREAALLRAVRTAPTQATRRVALRQLRRVQGALRTLDAMING